MLANRHFRPGAWYDHIPEAPVYERRTNLPPFIHKTCRETLPAPALFGWSGSGIVLFGEQAADRWIVARAWRKGDALTDVRRWSFVAPALFTRQVRRLVFEATADAAAARVAAADAQRWVDSLA